MLERKQLQAHKYSKYTSHIIFHIFYMPIWELNWIYNIHNLIKSSSYALSLILHLNISVNVSYMYFQFHFNKSWSATITAPTQDLNHPLVVGKVFAINLHVTFQSWFASSYIGRSKLSVVKMSLKYSTYKTNRRNHTLYWLATGKSPKNTRTQNHQKVPKVLEILTTEADLDDPIDIGYYPSSKRLLFKLSNI